MARPTKFDATRAARVVCRIDGGETREYAARAAGVCVRTLQGWLARGRADVEAGRPGALADFAGRFDRAVARQHRLRLNASYARESARSAERWRRFRASRERWWLERLGPERFWLLRIAWALEHGRSGAAGRARSELIRLIATRQAREPSDQACRAGLLQ